VSYADNRSNDKWECVISYFETSDHSLVIFHFEKSIFEGSKLERSHVLSLVFSEFPSIESLVSTHTLTCILTEPVRI
jgi:hypothetical protein